MTDVDDMLMDIDALGAEEDADVSMTDRDVPDNEMEPYKYKDHALDCYPYTFSPLLLFSSDGYFDRGYSNYNAVASFFEPVLRGILGDAAVQEEETTNGGNGERASPNRGGKGPDNEQQEIGGGINMLEGVIYERKNMT